LLFLVEKGKIYVIFLSKKGFWGVEKEESKIHRKGGGTLPTRGPPWLWRWGKNCEQPDSFGTRPGYKSPTSPRRKVPFRGKGGGGPVYELKGGSMDLAGKGGKMPLPSGASTSSPPKKKALCTSLPFVRGKNKGAQNNFGKYGGVEISREKMGLVVIHKKGKGGHQMGSQKKRKGTRGAHGGGVNTLTL